MLVWDHTTMTHLCDLPNTSSLMTLLTAVGSRTSTTSGGTATVPSASSPWPVSFTPSAPPCSPEA
jgi:hypothetical protein